MFVFIELTTPVDFGSPLGKRLETFICLSETRCPPPPENGVSCPTRVFQVMFLLMTTGQTLRGLLAIVDHGDAPGETVWQYECADGTSVAKHCLSQGCISGVLAAWMSSGGA